MHEDTLASISGAAKKKIELLRESRLKYLMSAGLAGLFYRIWNYAYFCDSRSYGRESS